MNELWFVGQVSSGIWDHRKEEWGDMSWEVTGIFSTEEKAVAACRDKNYFVMPLKLDESFPHEKGDPPAGSYYPLEDQD